MHETNRFQEQWNVPPLSPQRQERILNLTMKKIQSQQQPRRRKWALPVLAAAVVLLLAGTVLAASTLGLFDLSRLFGDRAALLEPGITQYDPAPETVLEAQSPLEAAKITAEDYHFRLLDGVTLGGDLLYARMDVSRVSDAVPDFPASGDGLRLGDYDAAWFTESSNDGTRRIVAYALADGSVPETVDLTLSQEGESLLLFDDAAVTREETVNVSFDETGACVLQGASLSSVGLTVWGSCTGTLSAEAVLTSAGGYPLQLHDTPASSLTSSQDEATEDGAGYLAERQVNDDGSFQLTWLFTKPFAPVCDSLTFSGVVYDLPAQTTQQPAAPDPYVPVLGTSADTQDYRFTLETVSATPDSICAIVAMEPLTDYGRTHMDATPELVVSCQTKRLSGSSNAILVESAEAKNRYLVCFVGSGAEAMEAGDLLTFELLSIYEDGDTAERGYHLFDIALEQVTGAVTLTPETESPFSQVRLTPMTLSLTAPIPGDGAEALDQSLDVPEVVLTYKDGGTETILDGTLTRTPFGQPGILSSEIQGTANGLSRQIYLLSLPVDPTAVDYVTIDGVIFHISNS